MTPAHDEPLEEQAARAQTIQAMPETAHSFRKSTAQRRLRSPQKIHTPSFLFNHANQAQPVTRSDPPLNGSDAIGTDLHATAAATSATIGPLAKP